MLSKLFRTVKNNPLLYGSLLVVFICMIVLIMVALSLGRSGKQQPEPRPTPVTVAITPLPSAGYPTYPPTPIPQAGDLIITGIAVNDFTQNAEKILPNGDVIIKETGQYQIVYLEKFESFIVSITDADIARAWSMGERDFLAILGIDEPNACRLQVQVSIPGYVDETYGGKSFPLSFCGHHEVLDGHK